MKLTKKKEQEIMQVYDTWMNSYLNGDVETYDSYLDDGYRFIGSTDNEEFLNRKDTTQFFKDTAEQFSGKTDLRNVTTKTEAFDDLIFITHLFDAWFKNGTGWTFYSRFRFTSVLQEKKDGWKFIYQHFSIADSKADEGETIGFDKVNAENQELREAIKRRTVELEAKNRELEIEGALGRIRAQATAMAESSELLDIVVTMRNEFTRLGHEAAYFWHMMWLPDKYEKAMTSGDGTRIGFVMELPRYIHGEIPLLAKWEKSQKSTVVYAMNSEEAINYVDKMVALGNFKNIDPQAPTHNDIRHIGGLTFIMARTTHGEIGYSLPGVVKNPPTEDLDILIQFASAFDLAHRRFLDLKIAEQQARQVQIELALEKIRSRTMAMYKSEELADLSLELVKQVQNLGVATWFCAFNIYDNDPKGSLEWGSNGQGTFPKYRTPREGIFLRYFEAGQKGKTLLVNEIEENECGAHYEYLCTLPGVGEQLLKMKDAGIPFPKSQIDHVAFFKYGYILFITYEPAPESHDIFKRFAKVFEQTYTRFLDLQKAEAQAREAKIEAALERTRTQSMLMQHSDELNVTAQAFHQQLQFLGIDSEFSYLWLPDNVEKTHKFWATWSDTKKDKTIYNNKTVSFPLDKTEPSIAACYVAWESEETVHVNPVQPDKVEDYFNTWSELLNGVDKFKPELFPNGLYYVDAYMKYGCFGIMIKRQLDEDEKNILSRFAKEFQRTYTRFLDLQKAEAQAKEAQIEAALERVRSRSMAMHKSEEMLSVIGVVSEQLQQLNLNFDTVSFAKNNQEGDFTFWITSRGQHKPLLMEVPTFDSPVLKGIYKAQKKGITFLADVFSAKVSKEWHQHLIKFSDLKHFPDKIKDFILNAPGFARSSFLLKNIDLYVGNYRAIPFTDQENSIFGRFALVFEQAYTRFLDLQKAEAQAREAQIESALEKVRSRSLAMHKPEELQEVITVVAEKLQELGVIFDVGGVILCTYFPDNKDVIHWIVTPDFSSSQSYLVPYFDNPIFNESWDSKNRGDDYFSKEFPIEAKNHFFEYAFEHSDYKHFPDDYKQHVLEAEKHTLTAAWSKNSAIIIPSLTGVVPSESDANVLKRFAKVFEQAYIRFMDLQKAEAQTREVQIENALEKVRSRTMAMQHSHELPEAANNLFLQVQELGIPAWSAGYCIWDTKDKKTASCNMSSEGEIQNSFILPTIGEGYNFYAPLQKGEPFYVKELGGDALVKHYDFMRTLPKVGEILEELINAGLSLPTFQIFHIVYFPHGYLMFITYEPVPEAHEIFKRFAKVFEQTYTRFLDLQKAEAQAREATKQASLDRVRGQIASMRSTADLDRITPLIWNELTTMGVPFTRCGVFIIDEPTQNVEIYLSAPDGHSLGVLHLQFDADPFTANTVAHWRKGKIFKEHWNREEFISWTQSLMERGQISDKATYQGAANPPESLNLHFIPFTQGMLYVGSDNPLNNEQIQLVQSLADAFAMAYARYEDFTKLEKAKQSVEVTLSELKATQNQLVQSEKMASLGELTAGIAHEIQNPLNFVNNFSEVSNELIDEMNEEIENGDLDEAKAIANDIKQNLEKINHHGKRADAIVKGMLQHSRSSSGIKEPTDINALADEYLRLAYHGLRAKDKSFNATMNTDFDDTIGKINVVPQDMGRVILNLITNAFYACTERSRSVVDEKKKSGIETYEPTVSIRSKKKVGIIEIAVKDNGNGIPQKVLDKIFQPFFTTKPTGQGTGLGLSMSYDIITKGHGGELKVETKEGEGTTFIIELPITS